MFSPSIPVIWQSAGAGKLIEGFYNVRFGRDL